MFVLTKFFGSKSFRDDFVNGDLYLSSLSRFTTVYAERGLHEAVAQGDKQAEKLLKAQNNKRQMDILEGTIAMLNPDDVVKTDNNLREHICTDVRLRALGFDYCNLTCFCKMEYTQKLINGKIRWEWIEPDMNEFGEYAIIVKNPRELIKRIDEKMRSLGYQYICGDVNYHSITFKGEMVESKHTMTLEIEEDVKIKDYLQQGNRMDYDAFDKSDVYKNQREWRLVVNKGLADREPLKVNVGDLSDILVKVDRNNLKKKMDKLFYSFEIQHMEEGYSGNISRDEMKRELCLLGDNKGRLLFDIA